MAMINKQYVRAVEYICLNRQYIRDINQKILIVLYHYEIKLEIMGQYIITGNNILLTLNTLITDVNLPANYCMKIYEKHNVLKYRIVDLPVQIDKCDIQHNSTILSLSYKYSEDCI
jgi:hypothetical protein